ncbi:MAG: hypothetical protein K6E79_02160 [Pseudobutyrivibrio sp.]|nr:hypothetical protein [Pseudobutyrivibrio sp.]
MITVRTKRKIGMQQQQLGGHKEEAFVISLGQNFLNFIEKYSEEKSYEDTALYNKVADLVKEKDYKSIEKVFKGLQLFGTYDEVTKMTTKYKNISTACGLTYNGTVLEGHADQKVELDKIVAHTFSLFSEEDEEKLA